MKHDTELGDVLLTLARAAIGDRLGVAAGAAPSHAALAADGATFVTLRMGGELRGCIGTLEAHRALGADVRANAVAAAFRDPRFTPLRLTGGDFAVAEYVACLRERRSLALVRAFLEAARALTG